MKKKVVQILLAALAVASVGVNVYLFSDYGKTASVFNEVQTEIVTLDTSEKQVDSDISDMQEELTALSAEISNAEDSVKKLESDIQELESVQKEREEQLLTQQEESETANTEKPTNAGKTNNTAKTNHTADTNKPTTPNKPETPPADDTLPPDDGDGYMSDEEYNNQDFTNVPPEAMDAGDDPTAEVGGEDIDGTIIAY